MTAGAVSLASLPTRIFVRTAGAAGVTPESLKRAIDIVSRHPSMDMHSHLGFWEMKGINKPYMPAAAYRGDAETLGIIEAMIAGHCTSASVCLTGDAPIVQLGTPGNKARDYKKGEAWREYQRQLANLRGFFKRFPMELARTSADVARISKKGKLAVFLSTEGGHMVEHDLSRLKTLRADGLTKFQPIHYVHTKLGDNQTDPSAYGGLSPTGTAAIRYAAKLGFVIDVAHASYDAAKMIVDNTVGPVVLSHTMMKYGPYLENRPRFITRDYAFLIAQTGGVVGTWTVGEPYGVKSLGAFVEATVRLVDTIGIDHVGWSTDYISFAMPEWFDDYHRFPALCAGLLEAGFSDADLVKFIGGNALRVYDAAQASSLSSSMRR